MQPCLHQYQHQFLQRAVNGGLNMKLRDNKCIINYAILLLGAKLDTTREVFSEAHKIIKFIVLHLPTGGTLGFVFS